MTINKLAQLIAKKEGKKKSVDIAQIKEVIHCLADIFSDEHVINKTDSWTAFREYAYKMVLRKQKKKK